MASGDFLLDKLWERSKAQFAEIDSLKAERDALRIALDASVKAEIEARAELAACQRQLAAAQEQLRALEVEVRRG